jgi:hypothetical protein
VNRFRFAVFFRGFRVFGEAGQVGDDRAQAGERRRARHRDHPDDQGRYPARLDREHAR